jgi:CotH kinase protein
VPGSPMGRGGLSYIGDDANAYKRIYEIKSKDEPAAWADLIRLCKTLTETPPEKLEAALSSMLDVDGALKFLALEKIGSNEDGYWTRASDYSLYQNPQGKFFVVPHDANETFRPAMEMGFGGPRGPRGPGGAGGFGGPPPGFGDPGGASGTARENPAGPARMPFRGGREENAKLDPFAGEKDPNKALLNKLLAVPALRQRYVGYLREMATTWLDWDKKVGPIALRTHSMIDSDFKTDTRQLSSYEAFKNSLTVDQKPNSEQGSGRPNMMAGPRMSLKSYIDQRREYLLSHPELQAKE